MNHASGIKKKYFHWENWPFWLIYSPLIFVWGYFAVKARAFWFMSNINPTIEFSGLEGETKQEMYTQLPVELYPKTLYIKAHTSFADLLEQVYQNGFAFPFIVKPEIGMQGLLFRKINSEEELRHYNLKVPVDYLVQELVDLPMEFSVFHIRYPFESNGRITGFIQKEYMAVIGDGRSPLSELIKAHPKASLREAEMRYKHKNNLSNVLPKGQKFILSIAGNHNRGAKFINLDHQVDEAMCRVFDQISLQSKEFHYGRYDVKCTSVPDLKKGLNISILEFNGAGAEPNHIYDCNMAYVNALKEIVRHWKAMFEIGVINKKRGYEYWGFLKGIRYLLKAKVFFKKLRMYDINIDVEK